MRRPDSLPPALFPLSVSVLPSQVARYSRWGAGALLGLLALWLGYHQVVGLGVIEPFLYLLLVVAAVRYTKPDQEPEWLEIDAAGNFFVTLRGQRWRLNPEAIDACYAGWIHIQGRAWSDVSLDALKPDVAPQQLAVTLWRDSLSASDWQRVRTAMSWLEQRGEPLLGALAARTTKA